MLELRPNCEDCDRDLPPDSARAMIRSCECAFCADCAERRLHNVRPNCGGGFAPRPIRPATAWREGVSPAHQPASTKRIRPRRDRDATAAFVSGLKDVPPGER